MNSRRSAPPYLPSSPELRPTRPGEAGSLGGFFRKCNQLRSKLDSPVAGALMLGVLLVMCKLRQPIPAGLGILHCTAMLGLTLLVSAWSRLHPASYQQRREVLAAALRLLILTDPLGQSASLIVGSRVGQMTPGLLLGLASFLLISHSVRLAVLGLGLPLRAGAHLAVQLVMVFLAKQFNEDTCRAILAAGMSAVAEGAEQQLHKQPADPARAAAAAVDLISGWHKGLSNLSMWLRPTLPSPRNLDALQQCCSLFTFFQLTVGLLMPVLWHLVLESKMYCVQMGGQPTGAGGVPARPVDAADTGRLMPRCYRWVWRVVEGMSSPTEVLVLAVVLALVWEGVNAAV